MSLRHVDVAVFGGGVAGLWTLARLRKAGYQAVLFEQNKLGGGQSIASQGIIHGGTKYALTGKLTGSAQTIAQMPAIWGDCLQGHGELDLSAVNVVSTHQYLWTSASLASGIAGFFASKVMHSRMQKLTQAEFVHPFNHPGFHGDLYRLAEPVLNTASLINALAEPLLDFCYQLDNTLFERTMQGWQIKLPGAQILECRYLVLAAGQGNAALLEQLQQDAPQMQRRPLNMVMLQGNLPPLYAHCLGAGALPRLTITSDITPNGEIVWYLGGKIAEEGVQRSTQQQIAAAQQTLSDALPWLDFAHTQWACLHIDRAEPAMPNGQRPDDSFVQSNDQVITAWPTKLAFAPRLAEQVMRCLPPPEIHQTDISLPLNTPNLAQQPWYGDITWN